MRYTRKDAKAILARYRHEAMDSLEPLFADGRLPRVEDLHGDTAGRFLAQHDRNPPVLTMARRGLFLGWQGKRFAPWSTAQGYGEGINLFRQGSRYSFRYYVEQSRVDDKGYLVLDYRPYRSLMGWVRLVDEVRLIHEHVLLGRMYLRLPAWLVHPGRRVVQPWATASHFVGFFALVRHG
jgi:hypothetical protein